MIKMNEAYTVGYKTVYYMDIYFYRHKSYVT